MSKPISQDELRKKYKETALANMNMTLTLLGHCSEEDRLDIIYLLREKFCVYCGKANLGRTCQCWNDD